jgi:hypothetical protein
MLKNYLKNIIDEEIRNNVNKNENICRKIWHFDDINIIMDEIIENNWNYLKRNPNQFKIYAVEIRKYFAAKFIQRKWRNAICNPEYAICKKRLLREFSELYRSA